VNSGGIETIDSDGVASGGVLSSGGVQVVGGSSFGTVIAGGRESIENGGATSGTIVSSGGYEDVFSGGAAYNTTVETGGYLIALPGSIVSNVGGPGNIVRTGVIEANTATNVLRDAGAVTTDEVLSDGLEEFALSSGTTTNAVILGGGAQYIAAGAKSLGAIVDGGEQTVFGNASGTFLLAGAQIVGSGGAASATVFVGGEELISVGGLAKQTLLNGDGHQDDYGSANLTTLSAGAQQNVYANATSTTILSGGGQYIFADPYNGVYGSALVTSIGSGGSQTIEQDGFAGATKVSGGTQAVDAYGRASGTTLAQGGVQLVTGAAEATTVSNGAREVVEARGVTSGTVVSSGGYEDVYSGGTAFNTTVAAGGYLIALPGSTILGASGSGNIVHTGVLEVDSNTNVFTYEGPSATGEVQSYGLAEFVLTSGTTINAAIRDGGLQEVGSGGKSISATLNGGNQEVFGTATGTAILAGEQTIEAGGIASGTIETGGEQYISAGGVGLRTQIGGNGEQEDYGSATSTTVSSGGYQYVYGTASSTTVSSGGSQYVDGTALATTLVSGGSATINYGGVVSATTVSSGGVITVEYAGSAANITIAGGTAILEYDAAVTAKLDFTGGGTLALNSASRLYIPISGFAKGEQIDLLGVTYPGSGSAVLGSGNVLSATVNDRLYKVQLDPSQNFSGEVFGLSSTVVNDDSATEIAITAKTEFLSDAQCFVAGTSIACASGTVAVEYLKVGDLVRTLDSGFQPVTWIGTRHYDGRFIGGNHLALPICIREGALGLGIPTRDLRVSPGHAVLAEGLLVPAWRLVNGVSITQAEAVSEIHYFHIELPTHELVSAEGSWSESFLDDGRRGQFQNASSCSFERDLIAPGLPRVESGFMLEAVRRRLGERAGRTLPMAVLGPLQGCVDVAGPKVCAGWAQNALAPEQPVVLDVYFAERRVGRTLANKYRADLRHAGLGSGCHGFEVPLPAKIPGQIRVRRANDQVELLLTEKAIDRDRLVFPPPRINMPDIGVKMYRSG
jgi:autotransporter passenger strand-loop-strand repeat protein